MARKIDPRLKREPYYHVTEGEWINVLMKEFYDQCCDCGLVHVVNFRKRKGTLQMRVRIDSRATAAIRRAKKNGHNSPGI